LEHDCIDKDGDYYCDLCDGLLEHDCIDANGDYWCDICVWPVEHDCLDEDANSRCDLCGSLAEPVEMCEYTLVFNSYLDEHGEMTVLIEPDFLRFPIEVTLAGNFYEETDVLPAGTYRFTLSKENHVTRTGILELGSGDNTLELTIYPVGDTTQDGKVNVADSSNIYAHARGTKLITDEYAMECADVTGDGKINVADTSRVYAYTRGVGEL
jgi:hypothetical protein